MGAMRHCTGGVFVNLVAGQNKILPCWSSLLLEDTQMMHCSCEMIRGKEAWRGGKCRQSLSVNQLESKLKWAFGTCRLDSMANLSKKKRTFHFPLHPKMCSISGLEESGEIDWTHTEASCESKQMYSVLLGRRHLLAYILLCMMSVFNGKEAFSHLVLNSI